MSAKPQLCDYCHQKAKFVGHQYCSKTCATQAAALCNHCHKKPKYQNYEFCGKGCAALANSNQSLPGTASGTTQSQGPSKGVSHSKGNAPAFKLPFDPVELAKIVAQHIPQVQAVLASASGAPPAPAPQPPQSKPGISSSSKMSTNNPFLTPAEQDRLSSTNGSLTASSNLRPSAQLHDSTQPSGPPECLIPGCEQPVHIDAKGLSTSDYCSMKHRKEAAASGLASPCIMCGALPQGLTDYFCGRACREEALNKT